MDSRTTSLIITIACCFIFCVAAAAENDFVSVVAVEEQNEVPVLPLQDGPVDVNAKPETMASKYPRVVQFVTQLFESDNPELKKIKDKLTSLINPKTFGTQTIPEIVAFAKKTLEEEKEWTEFKTFLEDELKVDQETLSELANFVINFVIFEDKSTVTQLQISTGSAIENTPKPETVASKYPRVVQFVTQLFESDNPELKKIKDKLTSLINPKTFGTQTILEIAALAKSTLEKEEGLIGFITFWKDEMKVDQETLSELANFVINFVIFEDKSTVTQPQISTGSAIENTPKPETVASKFPHIASFMTKFATKNKKALEKAGGLKDVEEFGKLTLQQLAVLYKSPKFVIPKAIDDFKKFFENNDQLNIETLSEFEKLLQDKTIVGDGDMSEHIKFLKSKKAELTPPQTTAKPGSASGKNIHVVVSIIIPIMLASFLSL